MELQEIDVWIDKSGNVKIEVRGVKGDGCLELTRELEANLGGDVESREMSSEFYESVEESVENQEWQYGG